MERCIDPSVGVKTLSHDLLDGEEKAELDAHLERCAACRDLLQQTYGQEGALDELAWRAWRLSQRRAVPPHAWIAQRLRDLWLPFGILALLVGIAGFYFASRESAVEKVGLHRLAFVRPGTIDSTQSLPVPILERGTNAILVRPDRDARAYVYESNHGRLRRLVPPADREPPALPADSTREIPLPPLEGPESHVLLVVLPRQAAGTTSDWDAAVMSALGKKSGTPLSVNRRHWPKGVEPTLRWLP